MQLKEGILFDDRYRLIKVLGSGGFSEVWLAEDTKVGNEKRALKIYAPGKGLDDDGVRLFSREFQLVYDLNHTHLLRPSHFDVFDRSPYLVLPYCNRGSAVKLIGKITEDEAWHFLHDVASGLAYLHEQDPPIIHQDIKPDNILIDNRGNYLITDFGISAKARSTLRKSMGNVKSGGTIAYMAPERFGKDNTPIKTSDIWSLGATLFELLTGDAPFGEHGGLIQKGGAEIPDIAVDYSQNLKEAVNKMLAVEIYDRPTARQVLDFYSNRSATQKSDITKGLPPPSTYEIKYYPKNSAKFDVDNRKFLKVGEVLIVPSCLNTLQRQTIKEKYEKTGLKFRRFLSEPVAVALAYYFDRQKEDSICTVLILENGAMDISVLETGGGVFEVKCCNWDAHIGNDPGRIVQMCTKTLQDAGCSKNDIDELILVGASAYNPVVRQTIEDMFGKTAANILHPDKLAARGAAIYNGIFTGEIKDLVLLDVIPLSLGIETSDGMMCKVLEANFCFPTRKSELFSTSADNQSSVEIHVLEGDGYMASENLTIGRFRFDGIPPAKKGVPQIEISFDIDSNGKLRVTAINKETGKQLNMPVNQ